MNSEKSASLFEEAKKYIPGGVNSPVRAFGSVGRTPLFISRAKGAYIFDEDGNKFIDYVCSWGPCILGHANGRVVDAVKRACENGLSFGAPTKKETELARLITDSVEAAEQVRLVSSGTEAVMSAVRCARGCTGRDKIIKFEGNYHGHSDGLLVKAGSGLMTNLAPASAGVPDGYMQSTLLARYNDEESVRTLFSEYPNEIAAVIVEPVAANMGVVPPKKGFLEFLRDITEKHGSALIFDEVITGFRLAPGGAGEYYGIKPDMVTLGKIVGGGMPLAAYCGRKDIMQCVAPVGQVYQAGTLSGNPAAVTAGTETLKILLDTPEIYKSLDRKAAKLEKAYTEKGLFVNRVGSLLSAFFTETPVTDYDTAKTADTARFARYFSYMLKNGIYTAPSQFEAMFVSAAHSDELIEKTAQVIAGFEG